VRDRGRRGGHGFIGLLAGGAIVLSLLVIGGLLSFTLLRQPFTHHTVDRSAPPVLVTVRDLARYHAATGQFEVLVDTEDDIKYVPAAIAGERTLFIGVGSVDAYVDLGALDTAHVRVSPDGKTATITLPHAVLDQTVLDTEQSHVAARKRGLLNRVGGVFSDSPTGEQDLYNAAEGKIHDAATATGLVAKADANTADMLRNLLRPLGVERVDVVYADPPVTP
jgi:Protein of unknown function (DUF4230)